MLDKWKLYVSNGKYFFPAHLDNKLKLSPKFWNKTISAILPYFALFITELCVGFVKHNNIWNKLLNVALDKLVELPLYVDSELVFLEEAKYC